MAKAVPINLPGQLLCFTQLLAPTAALILTDRYGIL